MNTKNNKRKQESRRRIIRAFYDEFMQCGKLERISVSALCKQAGINRSTFYASYNDVYDLTQQICASLIDEVQELYRQEHEHGFNSNDFLRLLQHAYKHQEWYLLCLQLGIEKQPITAWDVQLAEKYFDNTYIQYHTEFFKAGFTAVLKTWLEGGCKETPEEIFGVIQREYQGRTDSPL